MKNPIVYKIAYCLEFFLELLRVSLRYFASKPISPHSNYPVILFILYLNLDHLPLLLFPILQKPRVVCLGFELFSQRLTFFVLVFFSNDPKIALPRGLIGA